MGLIFLMAMIILMLMGLFIPKSALAGGNSGVWPVEFRADGTVLDTTPATYVIDLTAKNHYTGNIMLQLSGTTVETPGSEQAESGVTVYYAENLISSDPDHESWDNVTWTLIDGTGAFTLADLLYISFDIPANPAAPYVGIKFELSGTANVKFGAKYSTTGNP
jgi:hypothetical protein